jgi:NAD(P)-dependent dehydrogenase (short-subunit alcohol dehydrogenase family)
LQNNIITLSHSVAFITGAGSGIGLAVAQRLVADGIRNLALIDITEGHLTAALASLTSDTTDSKVLCIGADCSKEDDVERAVSATVERFGRIDVCLNAAGVGFCIIGLELFDDRQCL